MITAFGFPKEQTNNIQSNTYEALIQFPFVLQVQEYLTRFESIPDMLELDHLTVSGDVTFGKHVSLKVRARNK